MPVLLSPSWLLFAGFVVLAYGPQLSVDSPGGGYVAAGAFALLLLGSVLLHEVGHCVVARALHLPVRSITVTMLAGLTDIVEPPQTPAREYAVAVVGPMVSLLLAAAGFAAAPALPDGSTVQLLCQAVAVTNGLVAAFNLLPGLPLDGGRVLRAAVWGVTRDARRSTVVSAWSGRVVAVVVVPVALLLGVPAIGGEVTLVGALFAGLVAAFLWGGATASLHRASLEARLPALRAGSLARPALRVAADLPLAEAVRRAQEAGLHALVVVDGAGRTEALVVEAAVLSVPESRRPWVTTGTVARRLEPGLRLDPSLSGEQLIGAVQRTPATEYLVADPVSGEERVLTAADLQRAIGTTTGR